MLNLKEKPHGLLLFLALFISVALILFSVSNPALLNTTMFGIPAAIFIWILPLLLLSFWLIYRLTSKYQYSKSTMWTHIILTTISFVLLIVVMYIGIVPSVVAGLFDFDNPLFNWESYVGDIARAVVAIFICAQFLLMANILKGIPGDRNS